MLKKKKQNVYFRFGLKPQQGDIFATYLIPKEEYGNLSLQNSIYGSNEGYLASGRYDLVVVSTAIKDFLILDNTIAHHPRDINTVEINGQIFFDHTGSYSQTIPATTIDYPHTEIGGQCFSVSVNEKKEIIYRYIENTRSTNTSINSYVSTTTMSGVLQVKEKILTQNGVIIEEDIPVMDTISYSSITRELAPGVDINTFEEGTPEFQDAMNLFLSGGEVVSSSYAKCAISPMGSIITAKANSADTNLLEPYYQPTVIDKFGLSTEIVQYFHPQRLNPDGTPVTDGYGVPIPPVPFTYPAKIITSYGDASTTKNYYDNWKSGKVVPTILKANDKDHYLITREDNSSFLLIEGQEMNISESTFSINGKNIQVKDYVKFFSATQLMQVVHFKNELLENYYRMDGMFFTGNNADDNKSYMIFSWFGNYIYKIRIDEIVSEPKFSESILYLYNMYGNPTDANGNTISIPSLKAEAEGIGLVPGSFFLDVLDEHSTSEVNIGKLSKCLEWSGIDSLLKIYHPETNKLWVDKFKIEISGGTARILFQERFLAPFKSPLKQQLKASGDWTIDTMNSTFTRLKSICYVPYDYVPPVDTEN